MANNKFVVKTGLEVGSVTVDATTGAVQASTYNGLTFIGSGTINFGTGGSVLYGAGGNLTAESITSGTLPGDRGVTAGSTSSSFIEYNGTTKTAGQFDGGTNAPTNTNRLNYDGNFYATNFYGSGANLTALNASNLSSGTISGDRGVTAGSTSSSFIEYNGTTKTAGQFDGGTTAPSNTTRLNYDGHLYATKFWGDGSGLTGINVANTITGTISVVNGGTGLASITSNSLMVGNGTNPVSLIAPGTEGQVLKVVNGVWTSSDSTSGTAFSNSAGLASILNDETGSGVVVFNTSPTFVTSVNTSSTNLNVFNTTATTVNAFGSATSISIGSSTGSTNINNDLVATKNLTVTGNLIVNGTTTTINSTTVTVDDPIFTIGGDTAPTSDDNKDRGIEFRYHTGTAAKVGFFGFDDSTGKFTFIPDATNTSEVFSGTSGTFVGLTFESTASTGTPPFSVSSTSQVPNLNVSLLEGNGSSFYRNASNLNSGTVPIAQLPAFTGGDVTSTAGSNSLTLTNTTVTAGTYKSVTVDAKGRVTGGTNPTTLALYGITDALNNTSNTSLPMVNGGMTSATLTTSTAASNQVVLQLSSTVYRAVKYFIQVTSGSSYEATELLAIHNGTDCFITEFNNINTGTSLASFTCDISTGNIRLLTTPVNPVTTIKVISTAINI